MAPLAIHVDDHAEAIVDAWSFETQVIDTEVVLQLGASVGAMPV